VPPIMKASDDARPNAILSTHPPTAERIKILRSMGTSVGFAAYNSACENVNGKGVIGAASLRSAEELEMRGIKATEHHEVADVKKQTREATDILHRLNGFLFIPCSCGLRIKVPPTFNRNDLKCPRCGTIHNISEVKAAAERLSREQREAIFSTTAARPLFLSSFGTSSLLMLCENLQLFAVIVDVFD